jgi:peptide/nickel transport system substrate-binding protein
VIYVHLNQWDDKTGPFVTGKDGKPLRKNPFKDARVRKALSMAINRDAIVDRIMEKKAVPAAQLLPDFFPGNQQEAEAREYDPEAPRSSSPRRATPAASRSPSTAEQPLHQRRRHLPGDRAVLFARGHRREGRDDAIERVLHAGHQGRVRLHGPRLGDRVGRAGLEPALAAGDPRSGQGHGRAPTAALLQPGFDKMVTTPLVTMDDQKREAMIQQAAEV